MQNKDITHPKMRRRIQKPRIVLIDCPLEYKSNKHRSPQEADWARIQEIKEEQVRSTVEKILELKPDVVSTEKGISGMSLNACLHLPEPTAPCTDYAQHFWICAAQDGP